MKKLIYLCFLPFLGCKVTLGPKKDLSMFNSVKELKTRIDSVYGVMQTSDKTYTRFSTDYTGFKKTIDSIYLVDTYRDKPQNILQMVTILKVKSNEYFSEHEQLKVINNAQANLYNLYLDAYIEPLLNAEK